MRRGRLLQSTDIGNAQGTVVSRWREWQRDVAAIVLTMRSSEKRTQVLQPPATSISSRCRINLQILEPQPGRNQLGFGLRAKVAGLFSCRCCSLSEQIFDLRQTIEE